MSGVNLAIAVWLAGLSLAGLTLVLVATVLALSLAGGALVKGLAGLAQRSALPAPALGLVLGYAAELPTLGLVAIGAWNGLHAIALGAALGLTILLGALLPAARLPAPPLRVPPRLVLKTSGVLLAGCVGIYLLAWPWSAPAQAVATGGVLPRWGGALLLAAFLIYLRRALRAVADPDPQQDLLRRLDRWACGNLGRPGRWRPPAARLVLGGPPPGVALAWLAGGVLALAAAANGLLLALDALGARLGLADAYVGVTLGGLALALPALASGLSARLRGMALLAGRNGHASAFFALFAVVGSVALAHPGGLPVASDLLVVFLPATVVLVLGAQLALLSAPARGRLVFTGLTLGCYAALVLVGALR